MRPPARIPAAPALVLLALAGCAGMPGAPTAALGPPYVGDEQAAPATGPAPADQWVEAEPAGQDAGADPAEQAAGAEQARQGDDTEPDARVAAHTAGLEPATPLPAPETSWLDLGITLLDAGDPERARDAFIRSLRVEGATAAALTGAGVAAEQQGLLTEAKRHFEQARDLAPESVVVYNNLGAVLYRVGELHAARTAFRTALALSSGANGVAARNLGITELAIRRAEATEPNLAENPIAVQRTGSSTFRLMPRAELKEPQEQG